MIPAMGQLPQAVLPFSNKRQIKLRCHISGRMKPPAVISHRHSQLPYRGTVSGKFRVFMTQAVRPLSLPTFIIHTYIKANVESQHSSSATTNSTVYPLIPAETVVQTSQTEGG